MLDHIFREYDIRGKVDSELIIDEVYNLGCALAQFFKQESLRDETKIIGTVAIGMDGRLHSPAIKEQLVNALLDAGLNVLHLGICPTPVMYFSQFTMPVQAGIMITASHNPAEYNGFKICMHQESVWGVQLQEIRELYKQRIAAESTSKACHTVADKRSHGAYTETDAVSAYIAYLVYLFPHLKNKKIPAVVDCANAVGGLVFPRLITAFNWQGMQILFADLDGTYPNHEADPVVPENMQSVKELLEKDVSLAFGIGLDGDCDRMAPMTKSGKLIPGDQLIALFSKKILAEHPGASIIFDVKASATIIEHVAKSGSQVHISACGHSIIKHEMRVRQALLGGELSCHFCFKDRYFGYDDGIYAALRLFELLDAANASDADTAGMDEKVGLGSIVQRKHATLDELVAELPPSYPSPELRIPCAEEKKKAIVETVKSFFAARRDVHTLTIDGVRATMPYGWGLIRASNTQPALSLRFESTTPQGLVQVKNDFICALRDSCDSSILDKIAHG